jgi:hypothetical protein
VRRASSVLEARSASGTNVAGATFLAGLRLTARRAVCSESLSRPSTSTKEFFNPGPAQGKHQATRHCQAPRLLHDHAQRSGTRLQPPGGNLRARSISSRSHMPTMPLTMLQRDLDLRVISRLPRGPP